jgi:hypothetical protein
MIGEADIDGVLVPYLLLLAALSFVALLPIRQALRRLNLYRFVWHAGLFDIALFVVLLSIIARITIRVGAGGLEL